MAEKKQLSAAVALATPIARSAVASSEGNQNAAPPVPARRSEAARPLAGAAELHFPCGVPPNHETGPVFRPALYAKARLHYVHAKSGTDVWEEHALIAAVPESAALVDWDDTTLFPRELESVPGPPDASYPIEDLPPVAASAKNYPMWRKSLGEWMYREFGMTKWQCAELRLLSMAEEGEGDFRIRVTQILHEKRDDAVEKLRTRYVPLYTRVQERIRKAEQRVQEQEDQYRQQQVSTAVDIGSTLLGALFGRRSGVSTIARRAASGVGKAGRALNERSDIARAQEDVRTAKEELTRLEEKFRDEVAAIQSQFGAVPAIEALSIKPRKSDISVSDLSLAWVPWAVPKDGRSEPRMLLE